MTCFTLCSSPGPRLQVESGTEADPCSQRRASDDRVSPSSRSEAEPVLESWDRAAHQQQQVVLDWVFIRGASVSVLSETARCDLQSNITSEWQLSARRQL